MNKKLIIIFSCFFFCIGCARSQKVDTIDFDSKKWAVSSDYRYAIVKTSDFPSFEGKSKEYVKGILGEPDYSRNNDFIYCLDVESQQVKSSEKCKASYVLINFDEDNPFNITIVNVEPDSLESSD